MGTIPDGIYDFTEEALSIVSAWTPDRLKHLADALRKARDESDSRSATESVLTNEPELHGLAERFLLPRNRIELYALITLLLTAISLVLTFRSDPTVEINPQIVIDTACSESEERRK